MIRVVVYRRDGGTRAIECSGHAGFAEEGRDIVCSAVSALTAALANGLTEEAKVPCSVTDDGSTLRCVLGEGLDRMQAHDAGLLFDTFERAVRDIREEYPNYLKISVKEV